MFKFKKLVVFLLSLSFLLATTVLFGCNNSEDQITTYDIKCTYQDSNVTGNQTVCFYNDTEKVFSELKFNLFANAFREGAEYSPVSASHKTQCYPNGVSYGDVKINSVTSEEEKLDYQIAGVDQNILIVTLKEELFPNESVAVTIDFVTTLANVVH